MKTPGNSANPICPRCKSEKEVVPMLYGMPAGDEMMGKIKRGEVFVAGCMIWPNAPTHFCKSCQIKFDKSGKITKLEEGERGIFN